MPTGDISTVSDKLLVASTVHRTLQVAARDAGQELLQRGPRGGFCNGAGTFEQLMDCLMAALDAAGFLESVKLVVDVHASRLVPPAQGSEVGGEQGRLTSYDLTTFAFDKTALELTTAQTLLDIYLEWLEKYPITAFIEPFAIADVAVSKELLVRGNQVLQSKAARSNGEAATGALKVEGQFENARPTDKIEGSDGEKSCLLRVIADESVSTPAQLVFVNEQRGANAIVINTSKISTVSECILLAGRASELGWTVVVAAVSEEELEGEFLAEVGVGLRAELLLMGGLRSASTIAACGRLLRIEDGGVSHVGVGHE